jgi:branched-chain amino acid transport system substrate-binding protein
VHTAVGDTTKINYEKSSGKDFYSSNHHLNGDTKMGIYSTCSISMRLFALLLLMSYIGSASESGPSAASPQLNSTPSGSHFVKIGGIFALTGNESLLDLPAANGAELATKEINSAGGLLGRPLTLIIKDSEYRMDLIPEIAKDLIEQDKIVAGIGFTDDNSLLAAGPTFQNDHVPLVSVGATSPKITQQIGDEIFLACFGDNTQAAAGAEYAIEKFGKNAYLLADNGTEYTQLLADYFKSRFLELGGDIVLEDVYFDNVSNFSVQIGKVKALPKQPDFYYIAAMPYSIGPIVKQFRNVGLVGPIMGGDGYDTPDIISIAGNASDNVFFTTHALMDSERGTIGIKRFIAAYNKEYGHDPENAFAALGYDAIYLIADAMGAQARRTLQKFIRPFRIPGTSQE